VNRPIGKIQISSIQPLDNLTYCNSLVQDDTRKRELLKNPTKIEEIQEKKIIDKN
jgi:hypothetical protein